MTPGTAQTRAAAETITRGGFRLTRQRREVYEALVRKRDHPTAMDVFFRVKGRVPGISLATVYNCLETLTRCGLVRQVNLERSAARYCPNLQNHGHFFCDTCGAVFDVDLPDGEDPAGHWKLPARCVVTHHELSLRGLCPDCAGKRKRKSTAPSLS